MTPGSLPLTEDDARQALKQIRKDAIELGLWLYPNVGAIYLHPGHAPAPSPVGSFAALPRTSYDITGRDKLAPSAAARRTQGGLLVQVVTDNNRYFEYEMGKARLLLDQAVSGFGKPTYTSQAKAYNAGVELARQTILLQPPGPVRDMLLGRLPPPLA